MFGYNPSPLTTLKDIDILIDIKEELRDGKPAEVNHNTSKSAEEVQEKFKLDLTSAGFTTADLLSMIDSSTEIKNETQVEDKQDRDDIVEKAITNSEITNTENNKQIDKNNQQTVIYRIPDEVLAEQKRQQAELEKARLELAEMQRKAEIAELQKKAEQEANAKIEAERAKLEAERKELEAIRAENERLRLEAEKQSLVREQQRIEDERKRETERKRLEEERLQLERDRIAAERAQLERQKQSIEQENNRRNEQLLAEQARLKAEADKRKQADIAEKRRKLKELQELKAARDRAAAEKEAASKKDKSSKTPKSIDIDNLPEVSVSATARYDDMDIDALYRTVRGYIVKNGMSKGLVSRSLLDKQFGKSNVDKLIFKSYLISVGKGVTFGNG